MNYSIKKPNYPRPIGVRLKMYLDYNNLELPQIILAETPLAPQWITQIETHSSFENNDSTHKCIYTF